MAETITTVLYKRGAYIVVEGEKSNGAFFIIQSGNVVLTRAMTVPEISRVELGEGDFFEVESALTGRRRLFSAVVTNDCSMIIVPKNMFDVLIQKRPSFVQKIILQFSQRMRKLDHMLTQISLEKQNISDVSHLVKMGEYYKNADMLQPAAFSYYHYIKDNPKGIHIENAKASLDAILSSGKQVEEIQKTFEEDVSATLVTYRADTMIFGEGMFGEKMYFINEGSVKICKIANDSEITLAVIQKGDLFGEMALLEKKPRSANAIAATDCSLLVIRNENFPILIRRQPKLIIRITTVLAERIWFVYRQIANVILPQGADRLFDALMLFMEREGVEDTIKKFIEIKISPKEMMKHTGMDTKIANETMKNLLRDKIISIKNNNVVINNPQYVSNRANHYRTLFEADISKKYKKEQ